MVKYILFSDPLRQEEIDTFYTASQMQRDYYRGYPRCYHPLQYFKEPEYMWQCAPEMSHVYLSFPPYHVRYRQPVILPPTTERTLEIPTLPGRSLAGRYNKAACKAFMR
ncbi:uncharacterized protein LOC110370585 [Helicoverpa armigera]|uniref:uncharacterized protein LOC110370585 n=1 Tax=Helicoverpa armigera TaxID=29058 RepID=UPI000B3705D9|nr:uncharacterized protein LOC110370585 [Helicoverpa armigera]PZC83747.1 hypothetical protein B5X24_HaOG206904 [Helicoverpa armigera]